MSIVVSVKVRDGIVLGADSMSQIYLKNPQGIAAVAQTYSNAQKLFEVVGLPIGIMVYGAGNIGKRSVQGLLEDFSSTVAKENNQQSNGVEEVTRKLLQFLQRIYKQLGQDMKDKKQPLVGVFVGGYSGLSSTSDDISFPEEWEFQIPQKPEVTPVRPKEMFGASWRGVTLPFTRLNMGIDPRIWEELKKLKVDQSVIDKMKDSVKSQVVYDAMPLQDAINFAHHIMRTTVNHTTFELGPPACGGPLDIAVIRKISGFKWVTERKMTVQL